MQLSWNTGLKKVCIKLLEYRVSAFGSISIAKGVGFHESQPGVSMLRNMDGYL